MAKSFKTVDAYLAAQPEATRTVLAQVRSIVRKALPEAEEVISYQIPAYRQHGAVVVFFAGWKDHYSIYPASDAVVTTFAKELAPYELSDKGTIRFPLAGRVPVRLITAITKLRAREVAARAQAPAKARAKATPKARAKATPKARTKATPKARAKATPKARAKAIRR